MKLILLCLFVAFAYGAKGEQFQLLGQESQTKENACEDTTCGQECKSKGWTGGRCIAGICLCWKVGKPGEPETRTLTRIPDEHRTNAAACDNSSCNDLCKGMGWEGGFCTERFCWCYKSEPLPEIQSLTKLQAEQIVAKACVNSTCDQTCKQRGFLRGGFCSGGQCWCWGNRESGQPEIKPLIKVQESLRKADTCQNSECSQRCKESGWNGGKCFADFCFCWKLGGERAANAQLERQPLTRIIQEKKMLATACEPRTCNWLCKSKGFKSGTCSGSACRCS